MTNQGKQTLYLSFAAVHFALVVCGAYKVDVFPYEYMSAEVLEVYQAYTGANSGYHFFAPNVATELRAVFEVTDKSGRSTLTSLDNMADKELKLRVGNIVNHFWDDEDPETQRLIAASLAGAILQKYPEGEKVRVQFQEYDLPNIDEYNDGARPKWLLYYTATFNASEVAMLSKIK